MILIHSHKIHVDKSLDIMTDKKSVVNKTRVQLMHSKLTQLLVKYINSKTKQVTYYTVLALDNVHVYIPV